MDWSGADTPGLTCREHAKSLQGAQRDNPLPGICQEPFALDRKERESIAFEKQQHPLSQTTRLFLFWSDWTRPWAEGDGWLLTSHWPWESRGSCSWAGLSCLLLLLVSCGPGGLDSSPGPSQWALWGRLPPPEIRGKLVTK